MGFYDYIKEAMGMEIMSGNIEGAKKPPILHHTPVEEEIPNAENNIDMFIQKNDISIDKESVETIIALINKSLNDWNREKQINGDDILDVVESAIKHGLIEVR